MIQLVDMGQANSIFLATLAIIALGYGLKRGGIISEQDGKVLSRLLMHTTFPALMVVSTMRVPFTPDLLAVPLVGIAMGSILLLIAWFWFSPHSTRLRAILTMGVGAFNVGLFGFPIIEGIWGRDALAYAVLFDIGNTFMVDRKSVV